MKLLGKIHILYDRGFAMISWMWHWKYREQKKKKDILDLIKIKNFCFVKELERQLMKWKKIFAKIYQIRDYIQNKKKFYSSRTKKIQKWTKNLKTFSKERQMVTKHIKRCSTSLIIREMQINTTISLHTH